MHRVHPHEYGHDASLSLPAAYWDSPVRATTGAGRVVISEVEARNESTIADEDGNYADWIELQNIGDAPVALAGYGLSDTPDQPARWTFPAVTLAPGELLLVWASGKNRSQPGAPLHTNFSLSAAGEPLLLSDPFGAVVDQIGPVVLPTDVSYGRVPASLGEWRFFAQPTPGAPNTTTGYTEILPPPLFSHPGGFYTQPFSLTIASTVPGAALLYTVDGSEPAADNPGGRAYTFKQQYQEKPDDPAGPLLLGNMLTLAYTGPLPIHDRSREPDRLTGRSTTWHRSPAAYTPAQPVFKGTVVRARAVKAGALSSPVATQSYFVTPGGTARYGLPVISLAIQENHLFDYRDGVYTAGIDFDAWRAAQPNTPAREESRANYLRRGEEWEYPLAFEFFSPGDDQAVVQNLGFRLHGGWTRAYPQKSLRLYADSEVANASSLEYPFFQGLTDRVTGAPITSFERLLLRNAGNDNALTRLRDRFIQTLLLPLGLEHPTCRPSVHFINGEFWGHIDLCETIDRFAVASHYRLDPADVAILTGNAVLDEGASSDRTGYLALRTYIASHDMADPIHYAYVAARMDLDDFMLYQLAQIYIANDDWPQGNISYWRKRLPDASPGAPRWYDGRWRWILQDLDHGFGLKWYLYMHDTLSWATQSGGNQDWATVILRSLLANPGFRVGFINAMADHMNTTFQPRHVEQVLARLQEELQPVLAEHVQRWPNTGSTSVAAINQFARARPAYMHRYMTNYFGLAGTAQITLAVVGPAGGSLRINSLAIDAATPGLPNPAQPYPWQGVYYRDVPVQVTAVPKPGYRFAGWVEYPEHEHSTLAVTPVGDMTLTAVFAPQALLHYWDFNAVEQLLTPAHTTGGAGLAADLHGGAELTFDTEAEFAGENVRLGAGIGAHLRVNTPLDATLTFHLPTTGCRDVVLKYEMRRSRQGAGRQEIAYTTDGITFVPFGSYPVVDGKPQLFALDFSAIEAADDNPNFAVRIAFRTDQGETSGNIRIDNVTLEGDRLRFLPLVRG